MALGVPKNSPYWFGGNVAPVQHPNVPPVPGASKPVNAVDLGAPGSPTGGGYEPYVAPYVAPAPAVDPHWVKTDFDKLIPGDWEVTGAESAAKEDKDSAEAATQRNLRQSFIDFGGNYSSLSDEFKKYIDPATIEAAKTNKFSQIAQNLTAMNRNLATRRAQLAGRGLTFGGVNTGVTREALTARELGDYNAGRTFTSGAYTSLDTLAAAIRAGRDKVAAARGSAAARLAAAYPDVWDEGHAAQIPSTASGGYNAIGGDYTPQPLTDIHGVAYTPSGGLDDPSVALNAARLRRMQELGY